MQRTKCQYRRLLQVLDLIRKGREPQDNLPSLSGVRRRGTLANCRTIANELEVSIKTVQRDVSFLIDQLGAPIEYDDQSHGYYLTEPCYELPGGLVTADDVHKLVIAERVLESYGYDSLARTITAVMERTPSPAAASFGDLRERATKHLVIRNSAGRACDPDVWEILAQGLLLNRRVLVSLKQTQPHAWMAFRLDPYRLALEGGLWTVAGLAHKKGHESVYRTELLEGIAEAALSTTTFCRIHSEGPSDHAPSAANMIPDWDVGRVNNSSAEVVAAA